MSIDDELQDKKMEGVSDALSNMNSFTERAVQLLREVETKVPVHYSLRIMKLLEEWDATDD
jgi:hypothetical protein